MLFNMAMVVGVTLTILALLPFIGLFILMAQISSSMSIHFSFAASAVWLLCLWDLEERSGR